VTVTKPVAQKRHRCIECAGDIEPGERYERVKGFWEGEWESSATCMPCTRMRRDLCPCAPIGCLLDEIYQNNKEDEYHSWDSEKKRFEYDLEAAARNEELAWVLGLDELWASWKEKRSDGS